ncbi:MAG TPA: NADH-quinone oxidoreductase subunit D [Phycisphaerales bacterium]|nr:NADH-quinone oxidoreductase subunit D [Phycisphaerales bacterium]
MPYTIKPATDGYDVDVENVEYLRGHTDTGDRWTLNFGPQHPATHTTLRLVLELDGERIARCTPHIGYLHSGFEKLGEHLDYNQYVTIVSRMNYLSPIANDICWHHAVETLFGIDLTPRCKVLRTIMAEVARIQDHLLCVGAAALDLGAFTGFLYCFNVREKIYDLCDYISGQRFHPDWTRVGGVMKDLPDEETFKSLVRALVEKEVPRALADLEALVLRNRIFIDRTAGIGVINRDEAVAWSLSGPIARASGVVRDLRKEAPYLCYADNWDGQGRKAVEFKVPVHADGDVYARFQVRIEEMRQSCAIIRQLLADDIWKQISGTPVDTFADGKLVKPKKSEVYGSIEGLIQHFELIMSNRGWKAPIAEAYGANETANGELGYYVVADGGPRPWRARTRPPSFINYQVMAKLTEGHMLADVVAILGSLNVIAAELDR